MKDLDVLMVELNREEIRTIMTWAQAIASAEGARSDEYALWEKLGRYAKHIRMNFDCNHVDCGLPNPHVHKIQGPALNTGIVRIGPIENALNKDK